MLFLVSSGGPGLWGLARLGRPGSGYLWVPSAIVWVAVISGLASQLSEEAQAHTWQADAGWWWEASVPPDLGFLEGLLEDPHTMASGPPQK